MQKKKLGGVVGSLVGTRGNILIPFLYIGSALIASIKSFQSGARCPAHKFGVKGNCWYGLCYKYNGKHYMHCYSSEMVLPVLPRPCGLASLFSRIPRIDG